MRRFGSLFLLALAAFGSADISPEAKKYLDVALDTIQQKSIKRKTDWAKMRAQAYSAAKDAQKPADCYPAIRDAIKFVGDHHSGFLTSDEATLIPQGQFKMFGLVCCGGYLQTVWPGGPADKAGLQPGMKVLAVNGKPFHSNKEFNLLLNGPREARREKSEITIQGADGAAKNYTIESAVTDAYQNPVCQVVAGYYGYIRITGFVGSGKIEQRFANAIQDGIKALDAARVRGWIVDLRINTGGNMWPMVDGLGPLLGSGDIGSFVSAQSNDHWFYRDGAVGIGTVVIVKIAPIVLRQPWLPIVVLIDEPTASSGESTAIAFSSMPNVVIMGGDSAGLSTGNSFERLPDGAVINLCEAADADRKGKVFGEKIHPDIRVRTDWSALGSARDPAIVRAIKSIDERRIPQ